MGHYRLVLVQLAALHSEADMIFSKLRQLWIVVVLLLYGCVATQSLNNSDRARISSVYVSPNIDMPPKMFYMGPAGGVGLMFGAVGGLATVGATMSDQESIQLLAEKRNVQIDKIFLQELTGALKESGKLPLTDIPENASATIQTTIKQYGFSIPHGFSSDVVPILFVQCQMVDHSGRVVWEGGGHLQPLGNPVDSFPAKTLNDAKVIEAEWRKASQAVVKPMVDGLP